MAITLCNDCGVAIETDERHDGDIVLCLECMVEREKDLVVGRVTFATTNIVNQPVKVIKAADRPKKTADDYVREHEIALVKLLVPKYRDIVQALLK